MKFTEERILAGAQILLSIVYTVGYFWVLNKFLNGEVKTPLEWKDLLTGIISVLTAGQLMILQFWFSRSRGGPTPAAPSGG